MSDVNFHVLTDNFRTPKEKRVSRETRVNVDTEKTYTAITTIDREFKKDRKLKGRLKTVVKKVEKDTFRKDWFQDNHMK